MSDAVIKGFVDEDNKEYIGYFLPTEENRAKRQREAQGEEDEDEDDSYHYKLIREYTWNRKDKTMSGFEQNYFLVIKDDCATYDELETRVRLSKRRVDAGVRMANMRLIQRYRQFNDAEKKNQRKRLRALENEEETEDTNDEEEQEEEAGEEEEQEETQDGEENSRDAADDEEEDQEEHEQVEEDDDEENED